MNKNDRLAEAIRYLQGKGIVKTQRDVANKMGATAPNVSSALKGVESVLTEKFIRRFNSAFGGLFNDEWLISGSGEMLSGEHKIEQVSVADDKAYYTYLLPMSAAGGSLAGFPADGAKLEECEKVVSPIADVDFAITVYGDSMYPDYPSGARILIKKIDPSVYIAWGNVFVLDTANGVIVKELQPSEHEGKLLCHSLNPNGKFKDFEVSMQDINGMYRVLACVTMK